MPDRRLSPPAGGRPPWSRRVRDLMEQLTAEEMIGQITAVPLPLAEAGTDHGLLTSPPGVVVVSAMVPLPRVELRIRALQDGLAGTRLGIRAITMASSGACRLGVLDALGTAATWDIGLVERLAVGQAATLRTIGVLAAYASTTAGTDHGRAPGGVAIEPLLAAAITAAQVRGAQGREAGRTGRIGQASAAVAVTLGAPADGSWHERTMRSTILPAAEAAVAAGAAIVIPSQWSNAGISGHTDAWLLRDLLRTEWAFPGIVASTADAIDALVTRHQVAANPAEAVAAALEAGVDVVAAGPEPGRLLGELFRLGAIPRWLIEESVASVLTLKDRLGLLDEPVRAPRPVATDPAGPDGVRQAIVLVSDPAGVLPLPPAATVAVVADDSLAGDAVTSWVPALLGPLAAALPHAVIRAGLPDEEPAQADPTVLVLTVDPVAATPLAARLLAAGLRCVVLLCSDRIDDLDSLATTTASVLVCWDEPDRVAAALAPILGGAAEPEGRLPVGVPSAATGRPAGYPVGHGLGYTSFRYSRLRLDPVVLANEDTVRVQCTVTNTGGRAGREVVQVYLNRRTGTVADPRPLVGFATVHLDAGRRQTVTVEIPLNRLAGWDRSMRHVLLPGDVEVLVGRSATDIRLSATLTIGLTRAIGQDRNP